MTKKQMAISILENMVQECAKNMHAAGIPIHDERVYEVTVRPLRGTRAMVVFGLNPEDGLTYFSICIHRDIINHIDNEYALANVKNSIYHELLHTCDNARTHDGEWLKWSKYCDEHLGTRTRLFREDDVYYNADAVYNTYVCPVCGGEYRTVKEYGVANCPYCKKHMNRNN